MKQENKGIFIPYNILIDEKLSYSEKIILSYINSFDTFFMSQQKISDYLNIPLITIKKAIENLISKNYLKYDKTQNKYNRKSLKIIKKTEYRDPQKTSFKNQVSSAVKRFNESDKKYNEKELKSHFLSEKELDNIEF